MELILWRHAEAAPGDPDAARALTDHGRRQAEAMARWLAPRLSRELRMIVSPARRAQETARALGRSFETVEALAPGCDVATLLKIAVGRARIAPFSSSVTSRRSARRPRD